MTFMEHRACVRFQMVLAISWVLAIGASGAQAFSEPDAIYYGTVSIDGALASPGTEVSARRGGAVVAAYELGSTPMGSGSYILRIPLMPVESMLLQEPGVVRIGDSVGIFVGASEAGTVLVDERGTIEQLNLALTSGAATPVATNALPSPTHTPPLAGWTASPATTPSRTETPPPTATVPAETPTAGPVVACPGDCSQDGSVEVDEITLGLSIALGQARSADCPEFDGDDNGDVTVDEVLKALTAALTGCPF